MNRAAQIVVVVVMLALLPLRALAAVAIGDCAMGQHGAAHQHDAHDPGHDGAPHPHDDAKHDHEHCASASFVASESALPLPVPAASDRVTQPSRFSAGFVPDHLDPPPLAL